MLACACRPWCKFQQRVQSLITAKLWRRCFAQQGKPNTSSTAVITQEQLTWSQLALKLEFPDMSKVTRLHRVVTGDGTASRLLHDRSSAVSPAGRKEPTWNQKSRQSCDDQAAVVNQSDVTQSQPRAAEFGDMAGLERSASSPVRDLRSGSSLGSFIVVCAGSEVRPISCRAQCCASQCEPM